MDKVNVGIEISEDVKITNRLVKVERYDSIPQKRIKNVMPKSGQNKFYGYRPGIGKYMIGGKLDV